MDIILGNPYLEADKSQQIQCHATGSNPMPAKITWWIGNVQLKHPEMTVPYLASFFFNSFLFPL